MPKKCLKSGCKNNAFSGGYCQYDQRMRTDEKYLKQQSRIQSKRQEKLKTAKPIKKESDKTAAANKIYNKRVKIWKQENPKCAYPGCTRKTADCHHAYSRGIWLLVEKYWIPLCRPHHDLMKLQPKLALALKLIFLRSAPPPEITKLDNEQEHDY